MYRCVCACVWVYYFLFIQHFCDCVLKNGTCMGIWKENCRWASRCRKRFCKLEMARLWPFLRLKEECCLPHTFLSLREGGDTLIKCHAERDRTWHKVGRPSTAFPLFTLALCECFLFFLLEICSILHWDFFATAEPESRPSDKIRNVRLPDSAPASHVTPSLFHTWTNDVPALSPNGRGYCVHRYTLCSQTNKIRSVSQLTATQRLAVFAMLWKILFIIFV